MINQKWDGFHPIYILAGLYTIAIYMFPLVFFSLNKNVKEFESLIQFWPLVLPITLGIINLFIVIIFKEKIGRIRLLNCAVFIKYTLIPFYIVGGLIITIALLLMFTPVVIMVFVGPMIATIFSILGWTAMMGVAPFSIGYICMSYKEGTHGKILSVFAGIFQFFFTLDVFSIMILALKEKRWVKVTIALMITLLLAIIILISWIILKFIGMLN